MLLAHAALWLSALAPLATLAADPPTDYSRLWINLMLVPLVGALVYVLRSQARDNRELLKEINDSHEKQVDKVCEVWKGTAERGFDRIENAILRLSGGLPAPSPNGDECHAVKGAARQA